MKIEIPKLFPDPFLPSPLCPSPPCNHFYVHFHACRAYAGVFERPESLKKHPIQKLIITICMKHFPSFIMNEEAHEDDDDGIYIERIALMGKPTCSDINLVFIVAIMQI